MTKLVSMSGGGLGQIEKVKEKMAKERQIGESGRKQLRRFANFGSAYWNDELMDSHYCKR